MLVIVPVAFNPSTQIYVLCLHLTPCVWQCVEDIDCEICSVLNAQVAANPVQRGSRLKVVDL